MSHSAHVLFKMKCLGQLVGLKTCSFYMIRPLDYCPVQMWTGNGQLLQHFPKFCLKFKTNTKNEARRQMKVGGGS